MQSSVSTAQIERRTRRHCSPSQSSCENRCRRASSSHHRVAQSRPPHLHQHPMLPLLRRLQRRWARGSRSIGFRRGHGVSRRLRSTGSWRRVHDHRLLCKIQRKPHLRFSRERANGHRHREVSLPEIPPLTKVGSSSHFVVTSILTTPHRYTRIHNQPHLRRRVPREPSAGPSLCHTHGCPHRRTPYRPHQRTRDRPRSSPFWQHYHRVTTAHESHHQWAAGRTVDRHVLRVQDSHCRDRD
jgi:hypothetical protein